MEYIIAILIITIGLVGYGYYRKQAQEKLKLALPPYLEAASVFLEKLPFFLGKDQYLSNYDVFTLDTFHDFNILFCNNFSKYLLQKIR